MPRKSYTIPYDSRAERWEPVTMTAQVRNRGDDKVQRLTQEVVVEDASDSQYPGFENRVLLLDDVEIESRIEAGDVAKIALRLNDGDTNLLNVLRKNSQFKVKVTLRPELSKGGTDPSKPGPPVEGFTSVVAQLPQTWDLTFRKTLWHDAGVIELATLEEVPEEQLQELGNWGGTLVLQPRGRLVDEGSGEEIVSTQTIAHARECVLDRGDEELLTAPWDPDKGGYVFEIEATQQGEAAEGRGGQELVIQPFIEPHQGWQKQLGELLRSARKIGQNLAPDVPKMATSYVQDCMDYLAAKTDEELDDRRRELNIWILNTSHFTDFMGQATEMFNKALSLLNTAHKRFLDNMVNFAIELVFALFDVVDLVLKSATKSAKAALKSSTKEMVEELSEKTARELVQQREVIEQGVKRSREGLKSLDDRLAAVFARKPTDISDPTPEVLRRLDEVVEEGGRLTRQRQQLLREYRRQQGELMDVEANLLITREIKENADQATQKEFLEAIKEKAAALPESPPLRALVEEVEQLESRDMAQYIEWQRQVQETLGQLPADASPEVRGGLERLSAALSTRLQEDTLISINKGRITDMLAKGPLGNRLKEVNKRAQQAKEAAEGIRYENVAWEHYKGFFSPLWWFMDWSLAQILWLYDLARDWIPGLALAESLLATAVDTVLHYVMAILNAMIDFMNSHHWRRSCINSEVRGRGQARAAANGIHAAFFDFPRSTQELPEMVKPRRVVSMAQNGSPGQMRAVKQQILSRAAGAYRQEAGAQKSQARQAFANLCRGALDANRLEQPAPEQLTSNSFLQVWRGLVHPMAEYEKAFNAAGAKGTDYLWSLGRFAENSTFQDWDGAIEWLAWAVAWGLRLGGVLAVFTGVGVAALPAAFAAAQGAEWIGAVLRPAVSWLGTMPDVIAFQFDVVLAAALAYEAATEGGVDLGTLVVPSEYVDWSEA